MSEDDALRKAMEGMVDKAGVSPNRDDSIEPDDAVSGDLDLPRIVVTEDEIIVLEEDWVRKDVEAGEDEEEEDDSVVDDLVLTEKGLSAVLENIVGGVDDKVLEGFEKRPESGDFYKAGKDVNEFYDGEVYDSGSKERVDDGYDVLTEPSVSEGFVDVDDVGRRKRSMLEVAGFEDAEAERKREIKRRSTWG